MYLREAHIGKGWLETDDGRLQGICLGHDFCAEHEHGADPLQRAFDPDTHAPGFEKLIAREVPPVVHFASWKSRKPSKVRSASLNKEVDSDKLNEAALVVFSQDGAYALNRFPLDENGLQELIKKEIFRVDLRMNAYSPDRHDMGTAWGAEGVLIWVRGEDNVARLKELRDAIERKDLAFNAPVENGFVRRSGLALGIASRFDSAFRDDYLNKERAIERLDEAAKATGISERLKAAGLHFHALSPRWQDGEQEKDVIFFLNPGQQDKFNHGWFSVAELDSWIAGTGPVIQDAALKAAEKAHTDAYIHGTRALAAIGLNVNTFDTRMAWADPEHTRLGLEVWGGTTPELPHGVYDLEALVNDAQGTVDAMKRSGSVPDPSRARSRVGRR